MHPMNWANGCFPVSIESALPAWLPAGVATGALPSHRVEVVQEVLGVGGARQLRNEVPGRWSDHPARHRRHPLVCRPPRAQPLPRPAAAGVAYPSRSTGKRIKD
jgi:hypothetical protein